MTIGFLRLALPAAVTAEIRENAGTAVGVCGFKSELLAA